ncbi:hypothetical protein NA56DRAFT_710927 [Hyaloscypha hepaticicola]|uniref:Uncharacterized protein n=1 Tax=Hyaloscypha hepaticicola TaxID=2082293 RepID=A0A2J6PJW7_9HELO|nr:hypothetical protein NA56DRAFT_710927 [Hyaloscypha hepaticicola]
MKHGTLNLGRQSRWCSKNQELFSLYNATRSSRLKSAGATGHLQEMLVPERGPRTQRLFPVRQTVKSGHCPTVLARPRQPRPSASTTQQSITLVTGKGNAALLLPSLSFAVQPLSPEAPANHSARLPLTPHTPPYHTINPQPHQTRSRSSPPSLAGPLLSTPSPSPCSSFVLDEPGEPPPPPPRPPQTADRRPHIASSTSPFTNKITESHCLLSARQTPTNCCDLCLAELAAPICNPLTSPAGARSSQASAGVPYQPAVTDLHQVPPRTSPFLCAQCSVLRLSHTHNLLHELSACLRTCSLPPTQAPNVSVKAAFSRRVHLRWPIFHLHNHRNCRSSLLIIHLVLHAVE